jgi:2-oxoisovalerate dehydrogenase E1 component
VRAVQDALDGYLDAARSTRMALLGDEEPLRPGTTLTAAAAVDLLADQVRSRELDLAARRLRARDAGYYTIASAGHEQNAVLGALLRPTDPCYLHYRSGAFMMARARNDPASDPVRDTLLSVVAAAADPIAEGRHKVWGSGRTWVIPQTSTIGSHLPRAVGAAFAIERANRLGRDLPIPPDAIVCCSFGDASINHATALAGLNAARYAQRRGSPIPIVFVCEDNRFGISVGTPPRWIEETVGPASRIAYLRASGDLVDVWDAAREAVRTCREGRRPVFLHLETVRLWGHAGSDVEVGYRDPAEIRADQGRDPLLANVRLLVESGAATAERLEEVVASVRREVTAAEDEVTGAPTLTGRDEVMRPLILTVDDEVRASATATVDEGRRRDAWDGRLPEDEVAPVRRTLAAHLNAALRDEMLRRPEVVVFGEDVGRKGGVYGLTSGLQAEFGSLRVFDTLLDETTILGLAQGLAHVGFLPVPEIQYLAYVHNALDQIRGEAASTAFFSAGRYDNPMVVRIASLAYQRGFGGHFHNDNAVAALREIPGLVIAVPARGDDGARMLRGALALAGSARRVVCFLEPIALYHQRDLHEDGDGGWLTDHPPPGSALFPGEIGVHHPEAGDVVVATFGNGLRMSLRAARRLREEQGISARVLDLRWLAPLPFEAVRAHAGEVGRIVVADECRRSGGVADALVADLVEHGFAGGITAVRSEDSYVPLGPSTASVLLSEEQITAAVIGLTSR